MNIVILGLSITSSWGNGHATTYRGLVRELAGRGHRILFLERDQPWYASNRDLPNPDFCRLGLYKSLAQLRARYADEIADADCVIVGSYVTQGAEVSRWVADIAGGVTAFYDIDTPVTLAALARGTCEYLNAEVIPRFDVYLSFTGGPALETLEHEFGAQRAEPLYCSVDPHSYRPAKTAHRWDLGYLGTFSEDRQPTLERLLIKPAKALPQMRFAVAGPLYPPSVSWPENVERFEHLSPSEHPAFYTAQRFTVNVTRADMVRLGYSPSVRLFEAAACGTPIISDRWTGLDEFFKPGGEILIADSSREVNEILRDLPDRERIAIGKKARARVLAAHTAAHRAAELEGIIESCAEGAQPQLQKAVA
jgi:spore maturation protein CgeB